MKEGLTIHSIVKNEPFVYYAIKAVYQDADKILLYDTGSNDKHTLNDIDRLLEEDTEKKIEFKSVPMDDQLLLSIYTYKEASRQWKGKLGLGNIRQMQIDATDTEYFLVVDGDEVHYSSAVADIKNRAFPLFKNDVCCIRIPLLWLCGLEEIFNIKNRDRIETTGRVFKTDKVYSNTTGFPEEHYVKGVGCSAGRLNSIYQMRVKLKPFFHYESYLKPWKRPNQYHSRRQLNLPMPEVMKQYPYYIDRYKKEIDNDNERNNHADVSNPANRQLALCS